jgi:hypothetical protein
VTALLHRQCTWCAGALCRSAIWLVVRLEVCWAGHGRSLIAILCLSIALTGVWKLGYWRAASPFHNRFFRLHAMLATSLLACFLGWPLPQAALACQQTIWLEPPGQHLSALALILKGQLHRFRLDDKQACPVVFAFCRSGGTAEVKGDTIAVVCPLREPKAQGVSLSSMLGFHAGLAV